MTVSIRRAQALGREAAYREAVDALASVETWGDLNEVVSRLNEARIDASATVEALS